MIRSFVARNNQILVKVKGRPSFGKAARKRPLSSERAARDRFI
jgi:hypothetical protein